MPYVLNRSKHVFLATQLSIADRFLARLRGLLATRAQDFPRGRGLWITPSRGVHMLGMRYAIDAVYVDAEGRVLHVQNDLRPWRLGPVRKDAAGVLELPAGTAAQTRLAVGDELLISSAPCLAAPAR